MPEIHHHQAAHCSIVTKRAPAIVLRFAERSLGGSPTVPRTGIRRAGASTSARKVGQLAQELIRLCPESREVSVSLTKLDVAVFWANTASLPHERPPRDARAGSPSRGGQDGASRWNQAVGTGLGWEPGPCRWVGKEDAVG